MKPTLFTLLSAVILLPSTISAALLSQDSFSGYTPGQIQSTTSPAVAGYSGNWTGVDFGNVKPAVTAGSLSYAGANYAAGLGNKVTVLNNTTGGEITANNSGRVYRLFDSSLTVTNSTAGVRYLSFLFQSGQETGATTYQTLALFNTDTADAHRNFDIGFNGGTIYNFGVKNVAGTGEDYQNTGVNANTVVHLFVVKVTLSATALSDSVTVWVDPTLGAGEPAGGTTVSGRDLAWDRVALSDYDGNSCAWDEVRWGATFNSVTTETIVPAVPTFTLQPLGYNGSVGNTVTLTALAESAPAPGYQWQKSEDGSTGWTGISGANGATLQFSSAAFSANGYYRVIADNGNPPPATSDVVEVFLTHPVPTIITPPASIAAQVGSNVTLSVAATGLGTLTYQWYKDSEPIDGATSATLGLTNIQISNGGQYAVEVTDHAAEADGQAATSVFSAPATVGVFEAWSGLVSHEPFDIAAGYAVGMLPGQNPTTGGFSGAWTDVDFGNAEPAVSAGSLTYAGASYLGSTGDKASVPSNITGGEITAANSGRVYRMLASPLVVGDNTTGTRYLSLLYQSGQETGVTVYQMLELKNGTHTDFNRSFDIGLSNNGGMTGSEYDFSAEGTYLGTGVAADTNVHLLVVKFNLSATANGDNVTVWVDPTLGAGEPTGGTTISGVNLNWDRLALSDYDGNSAAWDEIRWGSTFNSVTLGSSPANNYAAWIGGYSGLGGLTGFNDDADGDGIKNGVENLFGTNPGVSNQGIVQIARSGNTVTFQHPANATPASDVTAAYVWSTDLATFNAGGASAGGTTVSFATNTVAGTTTVTAAISGTTPAKLFFALKAIYGAP
ncbi:MAG: immunoglobulin domain-containing protein [Luteolibacter sp.]|uniref:immunoglobulin domain-containing protein n=1 Tax=Luteolibacter sp. TaxID=1962973 RepID=UPI003267549C